MTNSTESHDENEANATNRQYAFGLSSRQLFVLVVIVGLIGPGLAVNMLERANLGLLADIVWVVGYGTTIFVVWYIWIRPLDLVGPSGLDISRTHEGLGDQREPDADEEDESTMAEGTRPMKARQSSSEATDSN